MKLIYIVFAFVLAGCASVNADRPTDTGSPPQATEANAQDGDLMAIIVEQAFMIEALQGEIIALQEGGADYGFVYEVEPGQSLWMIADDVLGDPYKWMTIYTMNYWMRDPDLIYPFQVLILP